MNRRPLLYRMTSQYHTETSLESTNCLSMLAKRLFQSMVLLSAKDVAITESKCRSKYNQDRVTLVDDTWLS